MGEQFLAKNVEPDGGCRGWFTFTSTSTSRGYCGGSHLEKKSKKRKKEGGFFCKNEKSHRVSTRHGLPASQGQVQPFIAASRDN